MIGNVAAVVLSLVSFGLRWTQGAGEAVLPWGIWLSVIVFGLLLFNGWKGGELVFRHRVGLMDEHERHAASHGAGSDTYRPHRPSPTPGE